MEYYIVSADRWTQALTNQFGDNGSKHHFVDADVLSFVISFGKAIIEKKDGLFHLEFKNS